MPWPGEARGALCLTFDNLGEAAEIELGATTEEQAGGHFTATEVVPTLLDRLADHDLPATFFVEGLNAGLYPDTLKSIDGAGHEVAYHAWRHEDWASLDPAEQAANLSHGIEAFRELGLEIAGMRPPGGLAGEKGTTVAREAGLSYLSPAGSGAGTDDGTALLPFQWRHVDATSLLPPLAPVREQMTGSPDPLSPDAFIDYLSSEIDRLQTEGGFLTIVLHLYLIREWLGWGNLAPLLEKIASADGFWVASCNDIADYVLADPGAFQVRTTLDTTTWA